MKMTTLKIERMKQGLSQWELANKIGICYTKMSRIETGRLDPKKEIKIACSRVLRVSIKKLFPAER